MLSHRGFLRFLYFTRTDYAQHMRTAHGGAMWLLRWSRLACVFSHIFSAFSSLDDGCGACWWWCSAWRWKRSELSDELCVCGVSVACCVYVARCVHVARCVYVTCTVCCVDRVEVYTRENSVDQCREAFVFICFIQLTSLSLCCACASHVTWSVQVYRSVFIREWQKAPQVFPGIHPTRSTQHTLPEAVETFLLHCIIATSFSRLKWFVFDIFERKKFLHREETMKRTFKVTRKGNISKSIHSDPSDTVVLKKTLRTL